MIIPDKNLILVTSSLKPSIGVFNDEDRLHQTLVSLDSIRKNIPNSKVIFADISVRPLEKPEIDSILQYCDMFIDMNFDENTRMCALNGAKSQGENCLVHSLLMNLKHNPQLHAVMQDVKRVFKISARTVIDDDFDITAYDSLFGKFVFKKRIPSWDEQQTSLLITRMFSFCPSLLDTYLQTIEKNVICLNDGIVPDTEHAHFANIPEQHLIEFDNLHCYGWLSGDGKIEHY